MAASPSHTPVDTVTPKTPRITEPPTAPSPKSTYGPHCMHKPAQTWSQAILESVLLLFNTPLAPPPTPPPTDLPLTSLPPSSRLRRDQRPRSVRLFLHRALIPLLILFSLYQQPENHFVVDSASESGTSEDDSSARSDGGSGASHMFSSLESQEHTMSESTQVPSASDAPQLQLPMIAPIPRPVFRLSSWTE